MPFIRAKSSLSSQEKEQLSPLPQSLEQGYFGSASEFRKDCSTLISELLECSSLALNLDPARLGRYHSGS
ncbi:hypothetical protein IAQ61_009785 [Plenodomus lingam]|uniref:uncharacterized protein n=1 Tax=Leptosphaeria maculans TaxID=5022 RepID=UPI00331B0B74|nr:hypothetical protein IAQ61_009785 [Plenodomus lingam]